MARYVLDFGSVNAGGAPAFSIFTRLDTLVALTPPPFVEIAGGLFRYEYDVPEGVSIAFRASCDTVTLTGEITNEIAPAVNPPYVLDFGSANAGGAPSFLVYIDTDSGASLPWPTVYEIGGGLYFFSPDWTSLAGDGLTFKATLGGIELSDVLRRPATTATPGVVLAPGEMTLAQLRDAVRERSDTENDPHISDGELTRWVNFSLSKLWDILVTRFGDDYLTATATITTDGAADFYPLPNGSRYDAAPAFFKGLLVEHRCGGDWVPVRKFNLRERGALPPGLVSDGTESFLRYRLHGNGLLLAPLPPAGQQIRLTYAPRLTPLSADTDIADGYSGWLEYVIVDAAIKAITKQERDPSALMAEKAELVSRIEAAAANRDPGEPSTVVDVEGWCC